MKIQHDEIEDRIQRDLLIMAGLAELLVASGFEVESLTGDFVGFALWRGRYTIQLGFDWLGARFPAWSVDLLVKARKA